MFASLSGKFIDLTPTRVTIDCQGVGYEVHISLQTFSAIQHQQDGRLHTYLRVAEDSLTLYGFATASEKELFLKLISVSGVGANTARMMLSHLAPVELAAAITNQQVKTLEGIKGIGKKTAERIILELKDKVTVSLAGQNQDKLMGGADNRQNTDALEALVALGISRTMAETALNRAARQLNAEATVEERIKTALKML